MKSKDRHELSRRLTIPNELGLHARAAAQIARLAETAQSKVFIIKDGHEVDGTDMLDIMSLYCPCGTEVTVRITDPVDAKILNRIAQLIEAGFGES
jgi:phosphocarrier protein HPr